MNKTTEAEAFMLCYCTSDLSDNSLINLINRVARAKSEGPFLTLSTAMNWAITNGVFVTNQNYPQIVTSGNTLNLDAGLPSSYPKTGTVWYDLTNNPNNNGTLVNGVTYNSGSKGYLSFNGINRYISFTTPTNIPIGNSNYTISVWFFINTISSNQGLVGWGNYGTTNQVNAFKLTTTGLSNSWGSNDLNVTTTITNGNWYNAVATFNGTTRSIWVNGVLIGSDLPIGHNVPNANNLTIGLTDTTEYYNGIISEVQIFNRGLTSNEIVSNYNALLTRYNGSDTNICVTPTYCPQLTPTPTRTPTVTQLSVTCYNVIGIYNNPDPAHPTGGYIDYYNNYGVLISLTNIWDDTPIVIYASSVISQAGIIRTACVSPTPTKTPTQTPTNTQTYTPTPSTTSIPINCISLIGTVISPVPQTGINNYYGVNVALDPWPVSENVTVTGYIKDDDNPSNQYDFSITIYSLEQSGETANNVLVTGGASTATMEITGVTPTTVTYNGNSVYFCGFQPPTPSPTPTNTTTPTVTPTATPYEIITGNGVCNVAVNGGSGGRGYFEYTIQLGRGTGTIPFTYDAYSVPDQFQIYYNGSLVIDTGFRGESYYNSELNALGYPNVSGPGSGSTSFTKTSALPETCLVVITAPIIGTAWTFLVGCPPNVPTPTQTPTNTPTPSTTPPPNSVEWFGDPYVGYGGDPSGGSTELNGTVEIIGDPVTFRAYVYIPFVVGGGSASTNIWVGTATPATNRYVEIVSPPNDGNAYSTSFTLPAGTYDWQVNFGWFGDAGSEGEGGIDWVQ
jgi:hypothetical protein